MGTISFVLRTDKKKKNDEQYPIFLRYNHGESKFVIATKLKCLEGEWDTEKGKPKKSNSDLEDQLNDKRKEFNKNAVSKVEGDPEADKVRNAWKAYKKEKKEKLPEAVFKNSILARWNDYLEFQDQTLFKGKKRTKDTIRNNRNSRALFGKFLASKKRQTIKPEALTIEDFKKYEHWLTNSPDAWVKDPKDDEEEKTKSPNGVAKALKHFKSFLKWHIRGGGRLGFNISEIEYSETPGIKISLTENELNTIAQREFNGRLNLVRDLLVLQCSTGVRVSDLQRLCSNLTEDKTAFKIKTKKKGKFVFIPILPLAKEVLKRHNYNIEQIPETKYREGIKSIYRTLWPSKTIEVGEGDNLREVFIHEEISSHDMVRTFVNIAAKKGITVPTIATITGKSIQVLLKNYLSEDKDHAAKELLEKFDVSPLKIAK